MLKKFIYIFWVLILFALLLWGIISGNFSNFMQSIENRTFDIRQNISLNSNYKQANSDIVIIAIDDASYEYIMDNYGEWPLRRDIYANVIDFIEASTSTEAQSEYPLLVTTLPNRCIASFSYSTAALSQFSLSRYITIPLWS